MMVRINHDLINLKDGDTIREIQVLHTKNNDNHPQKPLSLKRKIPTDLYKDNKSPPVMLCDILKKRNNGMDILFYFYSI